MATGGPSTGLSITTGDNLQMPDPQPVQQRKKSSAAIANSLESIMFSYSRSQSFYHANLASSPSFVDHNTEDDTGQSNDFDENAFDDGLPPNAVRPLERSHSQVSFEDTFDDSLYDGASDERSPLLRHKTSQGSNLSTKSIASNKQRTNIHGSSFIQTCFNAVNILMGIGILSLPLAMYLSGWILGIGMLVYVCLLTNYTAKLLAEILDIDDKLVTYADIGYVAFGHRARYITSILFSLELTAASVALVVLMGDALHDLFPDISATMFKIIGFFVIAPTTFMPLSILSYTSVVGIFSTMSLLVVVLVDGFHKKHAPGSLIEPMQTSAWPEHPFNIPLSFGLMMAGFAGHAVFPNIKVDMKAPKGFNSMCNLTYSIAFVAYLAMGISGYIMFGSTILQEITQSIMRTPGYNKHLNKFAVWLIAINPFSKFALTTNPIHSTVESVFGLSLSPSALSSDVNASGVIDPSGQLGKRKMFFRILTRTIISAVIVAIAIVFPGFDRVMSLLGATTGYAISAILPILFHMSIFGGSGGANGRYRKVLAGQRYSKSRWIANWILLLLSVLMAVSGTVWSFLPRK